MECAVPEMNQNAMTNGEFHKVGVIGEWEACRFSRAWAFCRRSADNGGSF